MSEEFLQWLDTWLQELKPLNLGKSGFDPQKTALISVDMINGFCHEGPLASKEVASIIPTVIVVFNKCHKFGINNFLLLQDTHSDHAEEFHAYPPHCQKGSQESQTIHEIKNLPFLKGFTIIEKNSLSPVFSESYKKWMKKNPGVDTFLIIGNCTDLCVYTIATHLRLEANSQDIKRRLIVVADAIATYDFPVETAKKLGTIPHDGEILHKIFLYHMRLNGVEVVKNIV